MTVATKPGFCRCGHPLADHSLVREQGAPGHPYKWGSCWTLGCPCTTGGIGELIRETLSPRLLPPVISSMREATLRLGARWRYEQVEWGVTECHRRRCSEPAELLYDGLPLCIDCADDLLERVHVMAVHPLLAATMPSWDE